MICETEHPMSMRKTVYNLIAFLAIAAIPADASAAPKVGVAAAVQNDVQGSLGGSTRTLASGSDVFTNERIRTGQEAMAQILLLDKTSLTVGPRSELTLDRFVYNPSSGAGQVVVNLRGAFRFVSGSQASRNYTIRTPIGNIGVRGSVGDLLVQNQQVIVILVEGGLAMNFKGRLYVLDVPGTAWVFSPTAPPRLVTWDGTAVQRRCWCNSSALRLALLERAVQQSASRQQPPLDRQSECDHPTVAGAATNYHRLTFIFLIASKTWMARTNPASTGRLSILCTQPVDNFHWPAAGLSLPGGGS